METTAEPRLIPLDHVHPSETNPRRRFDEGDLAELTSSIQQHGVLSPILVRPCLSGDFELVAGERRVRSAREAGLEEVPALVRELNDREVLELQVVENLQRSDLHPLDEAEGYRRLHEEHDVPVEELAERVGKSKAYVYARLKLCALPAAARQLFEEGKLTASTALLVARVPDPELATKAATEVAEGCFGDGEPMNVRDARDHLCGGYTKELGRAVFDQADEDLVEAAGPCAACLKRTGNAPLLFPDIASADVCTDPGCFARKEEAAYAAVVATHEAKGLEVLPRAEALQLTRYGRVDGQKYVETTSECYGAPLDEKTGKRPTYAKLLGRKPEGLVVAIDAKLKPRRLIRRKDTERALQDKGVIPKPTKPAKRSKARKATPTVARWEILRQLEDQVQPDFAEKIPADRSDEALRLAVAGLYEQNGTMLRDSFYERHELPQGFSQQEEAQQMVRAHLEGLDQEGLIRFAVDLVFAFNEMEWYDTHPKGDWSPAFRGMAELCGFDLEQLEQDAAAAHAGDES